MVNSLMILTAVRASIEAGVAILQVYHTDFEVEEKSDRSPLTLADRRSHEIIVKHLRGFDIPILSEEGKSIPYMERKTWVSFWLVDPLDGTKEFIKKNGEFTVNIALIRQDRPLAGVIYVPDKSILYFAANEIGSYKVDVDTVADLFNSPEGKRPRLVEFSDNQLDSMLRDLVSRSAKMPDPLSRNRPYTIVGSRSHATSELEAIVEQKRKEYRDVEFISAGSSLKLCLVAEGKADIYPRTGPTMEWDTAAGQAIVENAGAKVLNFETNQSLVYNKENLLNPWFVVSR